MYTVRKSVTGALTPVTETVELGFTPTNVHILNTSDRTELVFDSQDADNPYGIAIAASGAKTTVASAAAGISAISTDKDTSKGILIGASATVNTASDAMLILASYLDEDC